ncbi:MAG: sigma 54-interacting transcriptional regulator [Terracidiphilus sp.]
MLVEGPAATIRRRKFKEVYVESSVEFVNKIPPSEQGPADRRFEEIIGESPALLSLLKEVERVAPTDSTVLVLGETGTGKELECRLYL